MLLVRQTPWRREIEASFMFADIRGSTTFAERMAAEFHAPARRLRRGSNAARARWQKGR
jgi:class 3 adenylate cyclase